MPVAQEGASIDLSVRARAASKENAVARGRADHDDQERDTDRDPDKALASDHSDGGRDAADATAQGRARTFTLFPPTPSTPPIVPAAGADSADGGQLADSLPLPPPAMGVPPAGDEDAGKGKGGGFVLFPSTPRTPTAPPSPSREASGGIANAGGASSGGADAPTTFRATAAAATSGGGRPVRRRRRRSGNKRDFAPAPRITTAAGLAGQRRRIAAAAGGLENAKQGLRPLGPDLRCSAGGGQLSQPGSAAARKLAPSALLLPVLTRQIAGCHMAMAGVQECSGDEDEEADYDSAVEDSE